MMPGWRLITREEYKKYQPIAQRMLGKDDIAIIDGGFSVAGEAGGYQIGRTENMPSKMLLKLKMMIKGNGAVMFDVITFFYSLQ